MKKHQIFIDGNVGTTGLRIQQRLSTQEDIELLVLPEAARKDLSARLEMICRADLSFLCLPDTAAKEIASLAPKEAKICDASTAHRTQPDWVYGLAELTDKRAQIAQANRVAIPGCHATGFLTLITPLVEKGALMPDYPLVCHSLTGYSGGGKNMINEYESITRPLSYAAPRLYGLTMQHKHLPEMQAVAGLANPPLFCPVVDDYYSGMLVSIPLPLHAFAPAFQSAHAIYTLLQNYYQNSPFVAVCDGQAICDGTLSASVLSGKDDLEIFVLGNAEQILLCARFDNLGKGASGAAIQCMNLMLGRAETAGLQLSNNHL